MQSGSWDVIGFKDPSCMHFLLSDFGGLRLSVSG